MLHLYLKELLSLCIELCLIPSLILLSSLVSFKAISNLIKIERAPAALDFLDLTGFGDVGPALPKWGEDFMALTF